MPYQVAPYIIVFAAFTFCTPGTMRLATVLTLCLTNILIIPILSTDAPQSTPMSGAVGTVSEDTFGVTSGPAVEPGGSEALMAQSDAVAANTLTTDPLIKADGPLVTEAPVEEVPLDHFFSEAPIAKEGEVDNAVDGIPLDDVDLSVDAAADIDTASFDDQVAGFTFGPSLENQVIDL
ncbi:unnamed protein product [Schistocephalus solidus]|uniref:Secreted protein n=1 Tax=Schistocephalus solidus TaxID=70667 RepID=A0A183SVD2_SCHSO|nr:unnamed protein product [Schistocephalus solidus]